MADLVRRLRRLVAAHEPESDADLLGRFVADRDGLAFAALVGRHGPMVLAVCRRVLRHRQDAEDAFQATFLVLARRAAAVRPPSQLGNWLYGVAYRTALGARRVALARRAREARVAAERPEVAAPAGGAEPELLAALDRELAALPAVYRAAVVACDLQGLARSAAAARLGWTEGTLSSRLARARTLLARRLSRYGLAVPAAGLGAVAGPAAVAAELAGPTVRLGTLVAAGEAVIAAPVAALMEGAMGTLVLTKFKALAAALVVGCAVAMTAAAGWRADAAGGAVPTAAGDGRQEREAPKRAAPDPDKERIAELERERARLLKELAELRDRLARVEAEQKRAAVEAEHARKLAADRERAAEVEQLRAVEAERAARKLATDRARLAVEAARDAELRARDALRREPPPPRPQPGAPAGPGTPDPTAPGTGGPRPVDSARPSPPRGGQPASAPPAAPLPGPTPPPALREPSSADLLRPAPAPESPVATAPAPAVIKVAVRLYPVGELARDEREGEALVKVVKATVAPQLWGADAGVEYLPGRKVLVVRQTAAVQKEVAELLEMLRSAPKEEARTPRGR